MNANNGNGMKNPLSNKWSAFAAWSALMLFPSLAWATPGLYELGPSDQARKTFIEPLFGPLVDSSLTSPLTSIIMMFNSALLFVAAILVAYTIVAGVMSTAHDGEMMGKKWSAMWVPVRTVLGTAAILPVVGGGWSVIQVVVIWLAMQGAGLANAIWGEFIENAESIVIGASYNPPQNLLAVKSVYGNMLVSSACVAGRNSQVDGTTFGGDPYTMVFKKYDRTSVSMTSTSPKTVLVDERWTVRYGEKSALLLDYKQACGYVVLQENTKPDDLTTQSNTNLSREILDLSKMKPQIAETRRQHFENAANTLYPLGKRIQEGSASQDEVNKALDDLMQSYSEDMGRVARETYEAATNKEFLSRIVEDGFVNAGAFYMQITKAQDQVTGMITAPVSSSGGSLLEPEGMAPVFYVEGMRQGTQAAKKMVSAWRLESSNATQGVVDGDDSIGGKLVGWFMSRDNEGIFGAGRSNSMDPNQNPILMAKSVGDSMVTAAWSGLTLAAIAGTATAVASGNIFGQVAGAGEGFAFLKDLLIPIFMVIFSSLLVPGAILSTYLPLLPYILWIGVIFGWALLLIEAVIAAPLWAIAHIAPDGDGVVGRGGQGYMLVLSLVLRPPLMVIGLVASIVLMKPVGLLVNSTFLGAFIMGMDNPGLGSLTSGLAGLFIYMIVMIMLVQRVFALIHIIPDRLLRWIGGGGGELGQEAEQLGAGAHAKTGAAVGSAMAVSQASQSGIGSAMAGMRQRDETAATKAAGNQTAAMGARSEMFASEARASASESKAMQTEGPGKASSLDAASASYASLENSAHDAAERSARIDSDPGAAQFMEGLQEKRKDGDEASESKFLRDESRAAGKAVSDYNDGKSDVKPRPYQEALAKASAAHQKQNDLKQMSSDINNESISAAKNGSQPGPESTAEASTEGFQNRAGGDGTGSQESSSGGSNPMG